MQSRSTFDWGLDIADLLITTPCPDPLARTRFVQAVNTLMSRALGHRQQLAHRQAVMANMLADQARLSASLNIAPSAPGQHNIWARLAGARVGCTRCCQGRDPPAGNDSANWPAGGWLWSRTATT